MQFLNNRPGLRWAIPMTITACLFLGVTAYWYMDSFDRSFVSAPLSQIQVTPLPAVPIAASLGDAPKRQTEPSEPTQPTLLDTGTLRNFASKQAALEEAKLDVAIAEQQAKLTELREGKPVPAPVVISASVPVMPQLPSLPPLVSPNDGASTLPASLSSVSHKTGLVAIQGVDGSLSAVFVTSNGKKTVRVGDTILGSRVRSISLDGVTLASGKTVTFGD